MFEYWRDPRIDDLKEEIARLTAMLKPFEDAVYINSSVELADKIAGYAKIRLCESPTGEPSYRDWLVHERDRHLIIKALRFYHDRAALTGDQER